MSQLTKKYSQLKREQNIQKVFSAAGYHQFVKITDTLQGSLWRCTDKSTNKSVAIKVTNKKLCHQSMVIHNGIKYHIQENIAKEKKILKNLTSNPNVPNSIIKYVKFFKSNVNYFLVMEDGGHSLFDFVCIGHKYISNELISVTDWHKVIKIIFKQIVKCVEYIHSKNICHFDISLENILIGDVDVTQDDVTGKMVFCCDDIQIKLCDFGLAEQFNDDQCDTDKHCGKPRYKSPENVNKNQKFNAKSNDIWAVGVCLFMMLTGGAPIQIASLIDKSFNMIINDQINDLLQKWNKTNYVTNDMLELLSSILKYENERTTLNDIKNCVWLK